MTKEELDDEIVKKLINSQIYGHNPETGEVFDENTFKKDVSDND